MDKNLTALSLLSKVWQREMRNIVKAKSILAKVLKCNGVRLAQMESLH